MYFAVSGRWAVPVALILMSIKYWENYANRYSPIGFFATIGKIKDEMKKSRAKTYLWVSLWKIVMMLLMMIAFYKQPIGMDMLFDISASFQPQEITITSAKTEDFNITNVLAQLVNSDPADNSTLAPNILQVLQNFQQGEAIVYTIVQNSFLDICNRVTEYHKLLFSLEQ